MPRQLSPGERVSRKYRRAMIRRAEYLKLKAIVPSVARKKSVSKLTVIEEAIRYIDELHSALAVKMNGIDHDGVRNGCHADAFIRDLCNQKWFQFAERPETTPSYQLRNSPSLSPLTLVRTPLSDRQPAYLPESEDEEEEELLLSS